MKHKGVSKSSKKIKQLVAVLVMLLIGLGSVGAVRQYNRMQNKQELRTQGIEQYHAGAYSQAIEYFQQALEEKTWFDQKTDWDIRLYLADSYFLDGQYIFAMEQYEILSEMPRDEEYADELSLQTQIVQGFIDYSHQDYEAALSSFQAVAEAGHLECTLYAGICADELGREDEKIAYLTTYLSYDPNSAYACTQLADYYLTQGRYETSGQYIRQGLQSTDRSCDEALRFLEIVYNEYCHNYNEAYTLMKQYIEEFPVSEKVQREYDFLLTRQTIE